MGPNKISQIKTVELQSEGGPVHAIMIALDVNDPEEPAEFAREVAQAFKVQRMSSPPDTAALLITLIGDLSASRFAQEWHAIQRSDEVLTHFMSQMRKADVLHGTQTGQVLETLSLLQDAGA